MDDATVAGVVPRRSAGRPPDEEKTREILEAGRRQFITRGFEATTIESVAEEAGVSKVTVYKRFTSKTGLFAAIIRELVGRMGEAVAGMPGASGALRERLIVCGFSLMKSVVCREIIAVDRLVAQESERHQELAEALFEAGPRLALQQLAAILREGPGQCDLDLSDPVAVAQDLLSLWFGFEWEAIRLNVREIPDEEWLRQHVERCVDRILLAYRE